MCIRDSFGDRIPGLSANVGNSSEGIEHDRLIRGALLDIEFLPYESLLVLFYSAPLGQTIELLRFPSTIQRLR